MIKNEVKKIFSLAANLPDDRRARYLKSLVDEATRYAIICPTTREAEEALNIAAQLGDKKKTDAEWKKFRDTKIRREYDRLLASKNPPQKKSIFGDIKQNLKLELKESYIRNIIGKK